MTSTKAAKARRAPQRSCVACGKKLAKDELIRVVRLPSGRVRVDKKGREAGRGAYLCKSDAICRMDLRKKRIEYALRVTLSESEWAYLTNMLQSKNDVV